MGGIVASSEVILSSDFARCTAPLVLYPAAAVLACGFFAVVKGLGALGVSTDEPGSALVLEDTILADLPFNASFSFKEGSCIGPNGLIGVVSPFRGLPRGLGFGFSACSAWESKDTRRPLEATFELCFWDILLFVLALASAFSPS
jgi:hypothetical protein